MKNSIKGRKFSRLTQAAAMTGLVALLATGCATPQKYANHREFYAKGLYKESIADFEAEMVERQEDAGKDEGGEQLPVVGSRAYALDDMEMGSGYRALVELDSSNQSFERVEQAIREQQEESTAGNVARQIAAVLTSDNALPYQIQEYDSVMVNTYKALNLLQQGETDKARVEFKRVEERQRMAAERFKEQIAKAKEEEENQKQLEEAKQANPEGAAQENSEEANAENAPAEEEGGLKAKIKRMIAEKYNEAKSIVMGSLQDETNKGKLAEYEKEFSADTWGAQEAFTNPFASYMHGIFLYAFGEDKSDTESAVHYFEKACRLEPDPAKNPAAKALALATDEADGKLKKSDKNNTVFVVFENGLAPYREKYEIPLIVPLNLELNLDQKFIDVSVVLPKLVARNEAFPYLSVCDNGAELSKTVVVCNMDAVVASEYRERMPAIVLRSVLRSGIQGVLQVLIMNELVKQGIPGVISSAAMSAVFNNVKSADTRIWTSLPKNFQVAVVERPESGYLQFMAPGAIEPLGTAKIPEGGPSIVFVHTPAADVPATVSVVSAAPQK